MRRTPLQRTTELKRGNKPLKRTALKRVSPKRAEKRKRARERFQDGHGVYFDEVPLLLPGKVSDWHKVRIVDDAHVLNWFRDDACLLCGICNGALDPHHLIGGSRGRSDELCNVVGLCRNCHGTIQSDPAQTPLILRRQWKCYREWTDWVRLTLLRGSHWPFDSLEEA